MGFGTELPLLLALGFVVLGPKRMQATLRQTQFLRVLLSLRKKLEAAETGQQYLRTEPWVIYRFDPLPSSAR
jgi:hypothetical protein